MIGFDKHSLYNQLLLCPTFEEMTGLVTHDKAKPRHTLTLSGVIPTWTSLVSGLPYLNFLGNDWLECSAIASADLNFTTGDFSLAQWVNPAGPPGFYSFIIRGLPVTDGWEFYANSDILTLRTNQAGASQTTTALSSAFGIGLGWQFVGVRRQGASVRLVASGVDVTETPGTHIDPLTSNRKLHIGINDAEAGNQFVGDMRPPLFWGRALEMWEFQELFNMGKDWF